MENLLAPLTFFGGIDLNQAIAIVVKEEDETNSFTDSPAFPHPQLPSFMANSNWKQETAMKVLSSGGPFFLGDGVLATCPCSLG